MPTMTHLCETGGTQYSPADNEPEHCPICEDERQYVGLQGQQWTTLEKLQQTHRNTLFPGGQRNLGPSKPCPISASGSGHCLCGLATATCSGIASAL
jgi:hypothetical protein